MKLDARRSYAKYLAGSGFEVVEARRAREGLERLRKDSFDLVFADLVMPGNKGLELVENAVEISRESGHRNARCGRQSDRY